MDFLQSKKTERIYYLKTNLIIKKGKNNNQFVRLKKIVLIELSLRDQAAKNITTNNRI